MQMGGVIRARKSCVSTDESENRRLVPPGTFRMLVRTCAETLLPFPVSDSQIDFRRRRRIQASSRMRSSGPAGFWTALVLLIASVTLTCFPDSSGAVAMEVLKPEPSSISPQPGSVRSEANASAPTSSAEPSLIESSTADHSVAAAAAGNASSDSAPAAPTVASSGDEDDQQLQIRQRRSHNWAGSLAKVIEGHFRISTAGTDADTTPRESPTSSATIATSSPWEPLSSSSSLAGRQQTTPTVTPTSTGGTMDDDDDDDDASRRSPVGGNEAGFRCDLYPWDGIYADVRSDCKVFYICERGSRKHAMSCPEGTKFNQESGVCSWPGLVSCQDSSKYFHLNQQRRQSTSSLPSSFSELVYQSGISHLGNPAEEDTTYRPGPDQDEGGNSIIGEYQQSASGYSPPAQSSSGSTGNPAVTVNYDTSQFGPTLAPEMTASESFTRTARPVYEDDYYGEASPATDAAVDYSSDDGWSQPHRDGVNGYSTSPAGGPTTPLPLSYQGGPDIYQQQHHQSNNQVQSLSPGLDDNVMSPKKFFITLLPPREATAPVVQPHGFRQGKMLHNSGALLSDWNAAALPASVATATLLSTIHPILQKTLNGSAGPRTLQQVIAYKAVVKPKTFIAPPEEDLSEGRAVEDQYPNSDYRDYSYNTPSTANTVSPDNPADYVWDSAGEFEPDDVELDDSDDLESAPGPQAARDVDANTNTVSDYYYQQQQSGPDDGVKNNGGQAHERPAVEFPEGDAFLDFESPDFDRAEFRELYDGPKSEDEVFGSPSKPVVFRIATDQGPTHFVVRNPGADFLDPLFSKTAQGQDLLPETKEYYQSIADMVTRDLPKSQAGFGNSLDYLGGSGVDEGSTSAEYDQNPDRRHVADDGFAQESVQMPAYRSVDGDPMVPAPSNIRERVQPNKGSSFGFGRFLGGGRMQPWNVFEEEEDALQTHVHIMHGPNDRDDSVWELEARNLPPPRPSSLRRHNKKAFKGPRSNIKHLLKKQKLRKFKLHKGKVPKRKLEPPAEFGPEKQSDAQPTGVQPAGQQQQVLPLLPQHQLQPQAIDSSVQIHPKSSSGDIVTNLQPTAPPVLPQPFTQVVPSKTRREALDLSAPAGRTYTKAPKLPNNLIPLKISGLPMPYARNVVKDITYSVRKPTFTIPAHGRFQTAAVDNRHHGIGQNQQWERNFLSNSQGNFRGPSFIASTNQQQNGVNADPFTVLQAPNLAPGHPFHSRTWPVG